jgi:hypothetical protein
VLADIIVIYSQRIATREPNTVNVERDVRGIIETWRMGPPEVDFEFSKTD